MDAFIDFETYNEADIKGGVYKYAKDPSAEVICMAYWLTGFDEVKLWVPGQPIPFDPSNYKVHAFNASFEFAIWNNVCTRLYGWKPLVQKQMRCTAARASAMGLPNSLAEVCLALGLSETKDKAGHQAMLKICKPVKSTGKRRTLSSHPELFKTCYQYCKQDVVAEMAVHHATPPMTANEEVMYRLDQKINSNGIPVDKELCIAAGKINEIVVKKLNTELAVITKNRVTAATQRDKLKFWVHDQGVDMTDMRANTVEKFIKQLTKSGDKPLVLRALQIRKEVSRNSVKKYDTLLNSEVDGRIHSSHIYHRAHTGRWGSQGVQFQNLARGFGYRDMQLAIPLIKAGDVEALEFVYGEVNKCLSSCVRGAIYDGQPER